MISSSFLLLLLLLIPSLSSGSESPAAAEVSFSSVASVSFRQTPLKPYKKNGLVSRLRTVYLQQEQPEQTEEEEQYDIAEFISMVDMDSTDTENTQRQIDLLNDHKDDQSDQDQQERHLAQTMTVHMEVVLDAGAALLAHNFSAPTDGDVEHFLCEMDALWTHHLSEAMQSNVLFTANYATWTFDASAETATLSLEASAKEINDNTNQVTPVDPGTLRVAVTDGITPDILTNAMEGSLDEFDYFGLAAVLNYNVQLQTASTSPDKYFSTDTCGVSRITLEYSFFDDVDVASMDPPTKELAENLLCKTDDWYTDLMLNDMNVTAGTVDRDGVMLTFDKVIINWDPTDTLPLHITMDATAFESPSGRQIPPLDVMKWFQASNFGLYVDKAVWKSKPKKFWKDVSGVSFRGAVRSYDSTAPEDTFSTDWCVDGHVQEPEFDSIDPASVSTKLASFDFYFGFKPNEERPPTLDELAEMMCATAGYYDNEWKGDALSGFQSNSLIDDFEFLVTNYTYDDSGSTYNATHPLMVSMQVKATDAAGEALGPLEVMAEMTKIKVKQYIKKAIWKTKPKDDTNLFQHTTHVNYHAAIREELDVPALLTSKVECPDFAEYLSANRTIHESNSTSLDDGKSNSTSLDGNSTTRKGPGGPSFDEPSNSTSLDDGNSTSLDDGKNKTKGPKGPKGPKGNKRKHSPFGNSSSFDEHNHTKSNSTDGGPPSPDSPSSPDNGKSPNRAAGGNFNQAKSMATFDYVVGFKPGKERLPTDAEFEAMLCEIAYYYFDRWNVSGALIEEFDFWVLEWDYDETPIPNATLLQPLSFTIAVSAQDDQGIDIFPNDVMDEMDITKPEVADMIGTYLWNTPPIVPTNVIYWTETLDYYATPRDVKKKDAEFRSKKSCPKFKDIFDSSPSIDTSSNSTSGDSANRKKKLGSPSSSSSMDGNHTKPDSNSTSGDGGPPGQGGGPPGQGGGPPGQGGGPNRKADPKLESAKMEYEDVYPKPVTLTYKYSFFGGYERLPTDEEMESMICQTASYFYEIWNASESVIDKFEFVIIDWTYDETETTPLQMKFQVKAEDDNGNYVDPDTVLAEMGLIDMNYYLYHYVRTTPPFVDSNVFKHVETANFKGKMQPYKGDKAMFSSLECSQFADWLEPEDSGDEGNATMPALGNGGGEPFNGTVTVTSTFIVSTPKGTKLNESDIDDAYKAFVGGIAQENGDGTRKLRGRRMQGALGGVVDASSATVESINPTACPSTSNPQEVDCYEATASYEVSVPDNANPQAVADTYTQATQALIEDGQLNDSLEAVHPESQMVVSPDPAAAFATPPSQSESSNLIPDEGVTEDEEPQKQESSEGGGGGGVAAIIVVVVILVVAVAGGLFYCAMEKIGPFAESEGDARSPQEEEVKNKSVPFDDVLGTEVETENENAPLEDVDEEAPKVEDGTAAGAEMEMEAPEAQERGPAGEADEEPAIEPAHPVTEAEATEDGVEVTEQEEEPKTEEEEPEPKEEEPVAEAESDKPEAEEVEPDPEAEVEGDEAPATEEAAQPETEAAADEEPSSEAPAGEEEKPGEEPAEQPAETEPSSEDQPAETEQAEDDAEEAAPTEEGESSPDAADETGETPAEEEPAPAAEEETAATEADGDQAAAETDGDQAEEAEKPDEAPAATEEEGTPAADKPSDP